MNSLHPYLETHEYNCALNCYEYLPCQITSFTVNDNPRHGDAFSIEVSSIIFGFLFPCDTSFFSLGVLFNVIKFKEWFKHDIVIDVLKENLF